MKEIEKYLNKGYYVILDRYTTSNLAHQGSKIHDKDERFNMYQWIDKLEYWLLKLPKPDKTIFLHMPLKYTLELMKNRKSFDEHEKDPAYLKNSEDAYIEFKRRMGDDSMYTFHSSGIKKSPEELSSEVLKSLKGNVQQRLDEDIKARNIYNISFLIIRFSLYIINLINFNFWNIRINTYSTI